MGARALDPSRPGSVIARALASVPWWLWAIVTVAVVVRIATIGYGLPYELDPDEETFVRAALRIQREAGP